MTTRRDFFKATGADIANHNFPRPPDSASQMAQQMNMVLTHFGAAELPDSERPWEVWWLFTNGKSQLIARRFSRVLQFFALDARFCIQQDEEDATERLEVTPLC